MGAFFRVISSKMMDPRILRLSGSREAIRHPLQFHVGFIDKSLAVPGNKDKPFKAGLLRIGKNPGCPQIQHTCCAGLLGHNETVSLRKGKTQ
jgi:hypothetical protein